MATETLSAKELATAAGTDGRTMRKFLRDYLPVDEQPGQGGRYSFTQKQAAKLVKAFKEEGPKERKPKSTDAEAANKDKGGKKSKKDKATPPAEPTTKKGKKAKATVEAEEINDADTLTEEELQDLADLDGPSAADLDTEAEEIITLPTAEEKVDALEGKPAKRSRKSSKVTA